MLCAGLQLKTVALVYFSRQSGDSNQLCVRLQTIANGKASWLAAAFGAVSQPRLQCTGSIVC